MNVSELLGSLAKQGIDLWFEGDRLRFRAPKGVLSAEQRAQLSASRAEVVAQLRGSAALRDKTCPLSFSQQSLWFLHQQASQSTAYHVAMSARVCSPMDVGALRQAVQGLVDRHAILRTTYGFEGDAPSQRVAGTATAALDLHTMSAGESDALLRAAVEADYRRPFDLEQGPVFRTSLYTRSPQDHVLLITVHHIAADGWSLLMLVEELRKLYAEATGGPPAGLARPEVEYTDYSSWQSESLAGPEGDRLWAYWREKLASPRGFVDLPADRPRPAMLSFRGGSLSFLLGPEETEQLKQLARKEGTTVFVTLLASFHALLFRLTGTEDVIVGTPTFARSKPEFMRVVGDFVNSVPIRGRLSAGTTFRELLAQLRQTVLEALDAQEFPMPLLVQRLQPDRDPSRSPLFDTFFVLQRFDQFREIEALLVGDESAAAIDLGGLKLAPYPVDQQEGQFDLSLQMIEHAGRLLGVFKYSTDLFDHPTIARLADCYRTLVGGLVRDPGTAVGTHALLPSAERRQVLQDWNATQAAYPSDSVVSRLFEARVSEHPQAPAVTFEGVTLRYDELNARANQVAHHLLQLGIGPGVLVAVCLARGLDLAVALLGIQKAGGAYVPLDPGFPAERLAFMVKDSGAAVLVTAHAAAADVELPAGVRVLDLEAEDATLRTLGTTNLEAGPGPGDPAYVIYTSGSTGRPKGVVVPQGALVNFLWSMKREPGLTEEDVVAAVTTISFDIAGLELYLPWVVGARVEMLSRETAADGEALAAQLSACGATVLQATPATWRLLVEADWRGRPGFRALCGGEALPRDLADALLGRTDEVWNLYGPTETTIWSTVEKLERGAGPVTIGRPIANTQVYVLDRAGEPTPIGIPGEICIGGAGVAMGYHCRPELTADRFVSDRFAAEPGATLYRTGDLGRWRADGRLEHLGRMDHQVKIRGFRIELGEIEAVLSAHSAVGQAVVIAREAGPGDLRLVAYVVYQPGEDLTVSEVRRHLRRELPDYMVPSLVVALPAIPLTPNGKVDRSALPDPFRHAAQSATDEPPAPGAEQTLADIWREILQVERVGAEDNFFELGGHSLLSLRVAAAVEKRVGWRMDPRLLFFQNLRQVAAALTSHSAGGLPGR